MLKVRNLKSKGKTMTKIEEIKNQITVHDNMIEELVNSNAPDKVIGRLELKRQKLIERCNKLEATNTSTKEVVEEVPAADPYAVIAKGQCLRIPAQDPYAGQLNERADVQKLGSTEEKYVEKLEEIEKLNKTIEIYDDMILKIALHNPQDSALTDIKSKRASLVARVNLLVSETDDYEYIPSAQQILRQINELDTVNEKLSQCRTGVRRVTKNIFKIVTSPDYIPGELPEEINELLILKRYKSRVEEQEQEILKAVSKFFKAKLTI